MAQFLGLVKFEVFLYTTSLEFLKKDNLWQKRKKAHDNLLV